MPRNVSFHEWYIFHINKTLDGVHLDTFWCWARFMAFPYVAAASPILETYFADLQARLQAQPDVSNLANLWDP